MTDESTGGPYRIANRDVLVTGALGVAGLFGCLLLLAASYPAYLAGLGVSAILAVQVGYLRYIAAQTPDSAGAIIDE